MFQNCRQFERDMKRKGTPRPAVVPLTFYLPQDARLVEEHFRRNPGSPWIVKPAGGSQGKGIFLLDRISVLRRFVGAIRSSLSKQALQRRAARELELAESKTAETRTGSLQGGGTTDSSTTRGGSYPTPRSGHHRGGGGGGGSSGQEKGSGGGAIAVDAVGVSTEELARAVEAESRRREAAKVRSEQSMDLIGSSSTGRSHGKKALARAKDMPALFGGYRTDASGTARNTLQQKNLYKHEYSLECFVIS